MSRKSKKTLTSVLAIIYYGVVLYLTVFGRTQLQDSKVVLEPFSTIKEMMTHSWSSHGQYIFTEIVINICLLMPLGVFLAYSFLPSRRHHHSSSRHNWKGEKKNRLCEAYRYRAIQVTVVGLLASLFIEMMQYLTMTGTFAIDDIIYNTFGVLIVSTTLLILQKMKYHARHHLRKEGVLH